jgi:polar amino acid transport system substrate-binding protein
MRARFRLLTLLVAVLAIAALATACNQEEPTEAPVPTREVAAPETEPVYESAWARVEEEGTLRVATSADYPPFEYITDDFEIDGFDIALIKAIAEKLDVDVEVTDYAFDGLDEALEADQADVAIAAISLTPEREGFVDFSHIYFVSEDAFIAAADAEIGEINTEEDLASYRVGVQRGSVFQDWLEDNLVDTGLMEATDLFLYARIQDALEDLKDGRIDLIVMDGQPAQVAAEDEAFKIVAEGLKRERFAIAMKKGEEELRTNINQALITLMDDGTVGKLVEEYIGLTPEEIIPVPTPAPNPTSAPEAERPGCFDSMAWVSDLTYDDENMTNPPAMTPGQVFQKGWRVRNTGTCTWDSGYSLRFAYGNRPGAQMGGQPVNVEGSVAPGQTYDLYVNLVAPLYPGIYDGVWQMHNADNAPFGQRIYVGISVTPLTVPTPVATATPSPNVNFYADSTSIKEGDCTTIHWDVSNIKEVYFYRQGQNWEDNGVAGQGSREVCPSNTTTYILRVVNTDDSVNENKITINVEQNATAPEINQFSIDPKGQAPAGTCIMVYWDVSGDVEKVDITRNGDVVWDDAPFRGSIQDCPQGAGTFTYKLQASGPGGTSSAAESVTMVEDAPTPTPAPTDTIPEPIINGFSVLPEVVDVGGCVTIAWDTGGGTSYTKILKNGTVVQENAGLSGSVSDCLTEEGTYDYRLEAYNRGGSMVSADRSVQATGQQPTEEPQPTEAPESVQITSFVAEPATINAANACTTLTWVIEGQGLALVTLFRNEEQVGTDVVSPYQDCPDASLAGTTITYTLKADSEFGEGDTAEVLVVYDARPR